LTIRGLDRTWDNLTLGVSYEPTDTGNLANLQPVTASTRGDHAVNGILFAHAALHCCGNLIGGVIPDVDELGTTFCVSDQTGFILDVNFRSLALIAFTDG